ncbi:PRC-barrel domain containing protein [Nostoc sp. HG1]|nr:PRC-barrel domain containing protein [Nostoc sp. HG1]
MVEIAEWVAPIATMIAAMMTAANLGVRTTGWGFVVFTVGSIAWTTVGIASGQTNLIAANAFLTVVNVVGIWRWLGREVKYRDTAEAIAAESVAAPMPTLVPVQQIIGQTIKVDDTPVAVVVDAMVDHGDGRIHGLLARHGGGIAGIGERLIMIPRKDFVIVNGTVSVLLDVVAITELPEVAAA